MAQVDEFEQEFIPSLGCRESETLGTKQMPEAHSVPRVQFMPSHLVVELDQGSWLQPACLRGYPWWRRRCPWTRVPNNSAATVRDFVKLIFNNYNRNR